MTYRQVVIGDEHWSVRISDASVEQWLGIREQLRMAGYPDRPPDVDTPTIRAWVERPGEETLPYFSQRREQEAAGYFPVITMAWHAGGLMVNLYVTGFADGSFNLDAYQTHNGAQLAHVGVQAEPEGDLDEFWDRAEELMAEVDSKGWLPDEPAVTWPWDFEAIEAELELATADAKLGFVNPLPEGPVQ